MFARAAAAEPRVKIEIAASAGSGRPVVVVRGQCGVALTERSGRGRGYVSSGFHPPAGLLLLGSSAGVM